MEKTMRKTEGFTPLSHPMGQIMARLEKAQKEAERKEKPARRETSRLHSYEG